MIKLLLQPLLIPVVIIALVVIAVVMMLMPSCNDSRTNNDSITTLAYACGYLAGIKSIALKEGDEWSFRVEKVEKRDCDNIRLLAAKAGFTP